MRIRTLALAVLLTAGTLVLTPDSGEAAAGCRGRTPTITGTAGPDQIVGTPGDDVISGLGGDDVIDGSGGRDLVCGGDGDDLLRGGTGRDVLDGGEGSDRLVGGGGGDRLIGGGGDDLLRGGRVRDRLIGGPGRDRLLGDGGDDTLIGGAGRDLTDGGPGTNGCDGELSIHCGTAVAPACHPAYPGRCWEYRAGRLEVPLVVAETDGVDRRPAPVTSGVPVPRGAGITDLSRLRLLDVRGNPIPVQFTVLARWGAGPDDPAAPVRWLLLDFQARVRAGRKAIFRLVDTGGPGAAAPPLVVTERAGAITIDTGRLRARADGGRLLLDGTPLVLRATGADGRAYGSIGTADLEVTAAGPLRVAIRVRGSLRDPSGRTLLDYTARHWFYAGSAEVRSFVTVENNTPCPLVDSGQIECHDIGSAGSIGFDDLSLVFPVAGERYEFVGGSASGNLVVYQDSSGTSWWNRYATLSDWDGSPLDARPRMQAHTRLRGYRVTENGRVVDRGDHYGGVLGIEGPGQDWTVRVPRFWEVFPKALRAGPGGIEVGLFPAEFGPDGYSFALRAGEHLTHEVILARGPDPGVPLAAVAPAAWYAGTGAAGALTLPDSDWAEYEDYLAAQLDPAPDYKSWMDWYPDLPAAIARTDFHGIFDHGDWPIDYEGHGVAPLNPKYDGNSGAWLQWLRGTDPRWFGFAAAANRHLADVDVLHTLHSPRHWSDGIVFGHSYHDEEGFTNPHRNYGGSHPDTMYGVEGLLLTYYLTGYEKALESALEIADSIEYRLHNDWHLCGYFPDCTGEGYGLAGDIHDDGERPAANALKIAVDAYRATGDDRYLAVADALVEWSDAGNQPYIGGDPSGAGYLKPWMLGLYLRALGGYLELGDEFGFGTTAARNSYLAYVGFLRDEVALDLDPIASGPRTAMPYLWEFGGGAGNREPSVNDWLLLQADAFAYAHRLTGERSYLDRAARFFRAGSHDPWFEGDANTYSSTKEAVNALAFGQVFLEEWGSR